MAAGVCNLLITMATWLFTLCTATKLALDYPARTIRAGALK